jgi:hypothetical protein
MSGVAWMTVISSASQYRLTYPLVWATGSTPVIPAITTGGTGGVPVVAQLAM